MNNDNINSVSGRKRLAEAAKTARKLAKGTELDTYTRSFIGDCITHCDYSDGTAGALRTVFDLRDHTIAFEEESIETNTELNEKTEAAIEAIETLVSVALVVCKELGIDFNRMYEYHDGERPEGCPARQRKTASESDFSRKHLAKEQEEVETFEKEVKEKKQYADTPLAVEERTCLDNFVIKAILNEVNTEMDAPGLFIDGDTFAAYGHIWVTRKADGTYVTAAQDGAFNSRSVHTTVAVLPATRSLQFPGVDGLSRIDAAFCLAKRVVDRMQLTPLQYSKIENA